MKSYSIITIKYEAEVLPMLNQYTHYPNELYTQTERKLHDKHQAHYDYHGELDRDGDDADCYTPIKAVSIA